MAAPALTPRQVFNSIYVRLALLVESVNYPAANDMDTYWLCVE